MEFTEEELSEIRNALDSYEMEERMDDGPNLDIIRSIRTKLGFAEDVARMYNKDFGDDKICTCGHPYYRHFDTYKDMYACGCKYCYCMEFKVNEPL